MSERPAPPGPANGAPTAPFAPLVPLADVDARAGLTGPHPLAAGDLPAGAAHFAPAGIPPQVERLAARVLRREGGRARFPVDGPFNFGQEGARFGAGRGGHQHSGQDVFGRKGTPLLAVRDGAVLEEGEGGGRGNYLAIYDRAARHTYVYLHLERAARVSRGESVHGGQRVGELGCTGSCVGDHLHFEIRRGRGVDGPPMDPLPELRRWARSSRALATLPPGAH